MEGSRDAWSSAPEFGGMTRRLVVLMGSYPPPIGGEAVHVKQWAEVVRARGLEVEIVNVVPGAPVDPAFHTARNRAALLRALWRVVRRRSLFHLHTNGHNWKSWSIVGLTGLIARLRGARPLLTLHSGVLPRYLERLNAPGRLVVRVAVAPFLRVVCVNGDGRAALQALGVAPERLRMIPAFLGCRAGGELPAGERAAINAFRPLVVAVGGGDEDPERGLPLVVRVFAELRREFPKAGAVFVAWQVGPKVRPLIADLGLSAYARCLGGIPHEQCLALMARADVIVRSTFADGDSIAVREGLALGVPVVASDTAFRPEGTVLFRKGDPADLLGVLGQVLRARAEQPPRALDPSPANVEGLWRVYEELRFSELVEH